MRYYLLVLDEQMVKGSPKRALTEKENIKLTLKAMKEISILHSLWNNFSHFSSVAHRHLGLLSSIPKIRIYIILMVVLAALSFFCS